MQVLLVHGLGRTPLSLFGLASELRRDGHRTRFFIYSPTFETFPGIVRRLSRRLRTLSASGEPVGLIGHSLGGILLRLALADTPALPVHHFIMLGTPNQPPRMARIAWNWLPFRWLAGACGRFLATPSAFHQLVSPTVPHTVIAGTSGPCGRYSPFGPEPNDGLVAVSEAALAPGRGVTELPVIHSTMMDARPVRQCVRRLLRV